MHTAARALALTSLLVSTRLASGQQIATYQPGAPTGGTVSVDRWFDFGAFLIRYDALDGAGESFVAPVGVSSLATFSFWTGVQGGIQVSNGFLTGPVQVRAYVFDTWGNTCFPQFCVASMNSIFTSAPFQITSTTFQKTTITANVPVAPGAQYMAALVPDWSSQSGAVEMLLADGDTYSGGSLWRLNENTFGSLFTNSSGSDAAFEATFVSATPEPATYILVCTGLLSVCIGSRFARRRRS